MKCLEALYIHIRKWEMYQQWHLVIDFVISRTN